jgi:hypothetical protein
VHPIFKDASHMTMHKLRAPTHTKYTWINDINIKNWFTN